MASLSGKVAVIGGGSKNLGANIAEQLGARQASVVVHYNSEKSKADADKVAANITAAGGKAAVFQADFSKTSEVAKLFEFAVKTFGKVDISINCAGVIKKHPVAEVTEEEFDVTFNVNTKAAFFFIQHAGKNSNDGAKIITITTSLTAAFTPNYAVYAASKAAVEHFTRAAAKEWGARKISVNCIAPGPIDTDFFHAEESQMAIDYIKRGTAFGELAQVKDVAVTAVFLATDGWWTNGQTIFVNGGFVTR
eukprot:m.53177 g.53177  ORF g.53177 m.53177 type:complete len:250 (+) comp13135_c0_seq1:74-823(+)